MTFSFLNTAKVVVFSFVFVTAAVIAADASQGKGHGRGHGRGNSGVTIVDQRDPTPGIPTNPRGRGRNTNPGTPRGRFIRSSSVISTNDNQSNLSTPRKRRVRRVHSRH